VTGWNYARTWDTVASAVPDREAIITDDGRRLTFSQLHGRAHRLAGVLSAAGTTAGDTIGIALANGPEFVEAFWAALELGAVPANVNYLYRADELVYVLDDFAPTALVIRARDAAEVETALGRVRRAPVLVLAVGDAPLPQTITRYDDALASASLVSSRTHEPSGDDVFLLYTGGTTGRPKGVVWRAEDYFLMGWEIGRPGTQPPDTATAMLAGKRAATLLPASPLVHGTALGLATQTLSGGGTVVLRTEPHLDADAIWQLAERERVEVLGIVGDVFARPLIETLEADPSRDLSSLRAIVSSGMRFSPECQARFMELLPGVATVDSLGSSEGMMTRATARGPDDIPRAFAGGAHLRVVTDGGRDAVPGSDDEGLLMVSGRLPLRYHNDPEATAAAFREIDGVRYSIPGDRARVLADGSIVLLGRGSACINTGGEKVYPEEVETVLREHADVADVAVIGVPDPRWGEVVVAAVQPSVDGAELAPALDALCHAHLAGYKRPKRYVMLESIPRTVAGKPDYARLREQVERAPVTSERESA
jgi:acyl-CoA synthetase (AMP-forming)/AMP-acid ligase II